MKCAQWIVTAGLVLVPAVAFAASDELKAAVSYYQGCESLQPNYNGENVHPSLILEPGKIGKAFRMEQRWSVNLLKDPVLKNNVPDSWSCVGKPVWQADGGR